MRAYGKDRKNTVNKQVRRPHRGGKGCPCCGASSLHNRRIKGVNPSRARREGMKEAEKDMG